MSSTSQDDNEFAGGNTRTLTANVSDVPDNQYTVRVIATVAGKDYSIGSLSNAFNISRSPVPTTTQPAPVCQGTPNVQLTATGTGTINWYDYQFKPTTPNQPTTVPPNDYTYYVSQTVGGCESDKVKVVITVKGKADPPGVVAKEYCQNDAAQPLTASGQNLIWYDGSGAQLPQAPTPLTGTAVTLTYKVSQDNGTGCRSDQATVTVKIKDRPGPPSVTNPGGVCQYQGAPVLTASASSGGTLSWFGSAGNALPGAPTPDTQTAGSVSYQVSQNVNGCESATKATITQVIKPASANPTVTSPVLLCRGKPAGALTATGEALKWYDAAGGLLPNNGAAPVPNTDNVTVITYKVTQTQTGNTCESAKIDVKADIRNAPAQPGVTAIGLCQGGSATQLTAVGENLMWYDVPTGGLPLPAAPTPVTTQTGTKSYYVSQSFGTGAGACESPSRAELKVTVNAIPVAPTVQTPTGICQYIKPDNTGIAASITGNNQSLKWYTAAQSAGTSTAPAPTTDQDGVQSFSVTQTVNGCESPRATVTQTVNKAPAPPTLPPATDLLRCSSDSPRSLSATGASGSTLYWYTQAVAANTLPALGSALAGPPSLPEANVTVPPNTVKSYTYYVTQVDANKCQSLQQPISATIAGTPTAPAVTAQQPVCQNTPAKALTANVLAGATLYWNGPNVSTDSQTAPTPPTNATVVLVYTVRQQIGSCASPSSTITYTVRPQPAVPTLASPQVACIGQSPLSLTAAGSNLKWYTTSNLSDTPKTQVTIPTNQSGITTWYVTQTDGNGCQSASTTLEARIRAQATARLFGDDKVDLYDSTAIRIQLNGDGPWTLTLWNDRVIDKTLTNPLVIWVHPKAVPTSAPIPETYALKALSNDCGAGLLPTPYTLTIYPVTAVEPVQATLSMTAYPNPTTGRIQVDWSAAAQKSVTLRVVSATGSVIWQAERTGTGHMQTESIQAAPWAGGQYFLQLHSETEGALVNKIIKQ